MFILMGKKIFIIFHSKVCLSGLLHKTVCGIKAIHQDCDCSSNYICTFNMGCDATKNLFLGFRQSEIQTNQPAQLQGLARKIEISLIASLDYDTFQ